MRQPSMCSTRSSSLEPAGVTLRTRELEPNLTDENLEPAIIQAHAFLKEPLLLRHGEQVWAWEPERIASFISIKPRKGVMTATIDRERLARAIEQLAQTVDSPSAEPRVAFRNGQPRIVAEGQVGWRIRQPQAVNAISAVMQISQRTLNLPGEELTPQITTETLPTLGIVEVVGEGRSSYVGSAQYRITNIKAGAQRMDGVLIPPGAEFSFNRQLGEVDEANGFVQGYAVIGNSTQLEWGGGVCQDSTTVFRAAFWAGLPITERHAHPFYISWYDDFSFPDASDPGMDASIFTGVSDLKFVNDTDNWLLMEATTDDASQVMTVRLYGTKPNRTISIASREISNQRAAARRPGLYVRRQPARRHDQADRHGARRHGHCGLPHHHRERPSERTRAVLHALQSLARRICARDGRIVWHHALYDHRALQGP